MRPLVIAHRGDSAHRPENTFASFMSALEGGAELIEFDVQLTLDGHVVVMHDPTVDRTTNGHGALKEMTLAEVRALSAGYPSRFGDAWSGERVPTLQEALAFLHGRARAMIEIKKDSVSDDDAGGVEARTVAEVRRAGMEKDVAFLSFETRALARCRDQAPEVARGHLFYREEVDRVLEAAQLVAAEIVMPEKGMLSRELCDRARAAGIKVGTWVVDDPAELLALAPFELFGVGSNCPGVLIDA